MPLLQRSVVHYKDMRMRKFMQGSYKFQTQEGGEVRSSRGVQKSRTLFGRDLGGYFAL